MVDEIDSSGAVEMDSQDRVAYDLELLIARNEEPSKEERNRDCWISLYTRSANAEK